MTVVVTRPQQEADLWVARLRSHGIAATALPLIEISPVEDLRPLHAAWLRLADYAAVMFVSANAVRHFFAAAPPVAFAPRAWAPGPGTAEALVEAGVDAGRIDGPGADAQQFDSEALWEKVSTQLGTPSRVLMVRGGDGEGQAAGREWMSGQLAQAGVAVDTVVAYRRWQPSWGPAEAAAARSAVEVTWLFSSSEAIANLRAMLPDQPWTAATALATHPRIAQSAREAGFGNVRECRPTFEEVLACLQSAG